MRLFVAILPNDAMLFALKQRQQLLQNYTHSAALSTDDLLHLTLAFIGETIRDDAICQCIEKLQHPAIPLALAQAGRFQRSGGDIAWCGLQPAPALLQLQARLSHLLRSAGFELEQRPYRPHITLARRVQFAPQGFSQWVQATQKLPIPHMQAQWVSLMCSERIQERLTYTELASFRLL